MSECFEIFPWTQQIMKILQNISGHFAKICCLGVKQATCCYVREIKFCNVNEDLQVRDVDIM